MKSKSKPDQNYKGNVYCLPLDLNKITTIGLDLAPEEGLWLMFTQTAVIFVSDWRHRICDRLKYFRDKFVSFFSLSWIQKSLANNNLFSLEGNRMKNNTMPCPLNHFDRSNRQSPAHIYTNTHTYTHIHKHIHTKKNEVEKKWWIALHWFLIPFCKNKICVCVCVCSAATPRGCCTVRMYS